MRGSVSTISSSAPRGIAPVSTSSHHNASSGITPPANVYVELSSTAPNEDGTNVTPPVFTGYARQAASFGAPGAGAGSAQEIANDAQIDFGDPDADGSASHFALFDAASGGNMLAAEALDAPVTWQGAVNDPISFPVGSLKVSQD